MKKQGVDELYCHDNNIYNEQLPSMRDTVTCRQLPNSSSLTQLSWERQDFVQQYYVGQISNLLACLEYKMWDLKYRLVTSTEVSHNLMFHA